MYEKLKADVAFLGGDHELAASLYREGAAEGDELASFNYGYCLLHGLGVAPDPAEAKSFFAFARNMEGGEACYNLAMLYMHGVGVRRNYKTAFAFMRDSADLGCLEAKLYLGMAYTTGCIFEPDVIGISMIPFHKPEYRTASEALLFGTVPDAELDEEARFSVVAPDAREAFLWFQSAARHDPTYVGELVAKGKFLYAKCYLDGLGVDFDRRRGARLMLSAGRSGSPEAVAYLAENGISEASLLASAERRRSHH